METLHIKKISLNDLLALQHIGRQTFYETFSDSNSEENMVNYLNENFSEDKLIAELTNSNSEFYFALQGNTVIGYLKLNYGHAQTELKGADSLEIERIYVVKAFNGKQVGPLLFTKALEIARLKKLHYIWLGVWEKNTRAIHFYKKNGFVEFDKHIFKLGEEEQSDFMMKLNLKPV